MINVNDSYYGGYPTRTFSEIYPTIDAFLTDFQSSPLYIDLGPSLTPAILYSMLYAHYGNSHIAYSDENQFRYYLYSIIYQYGPTVGRKREIQDKLRALTEEEITQGAKQITNQSFNPSTAPIDPREGLTTINQQNALYYNRSILDGYSNLLVLLETDVIDSFIHKFRNLFIKVLAPDRPLLYSTYEENTI